MHKESNNWPKAAANAELKRHSQATNTTKQDQTLSNKQLE